MSKENIFVLVADSNPLDIDIIRSTLSSHKDVNYNIQTSHTGPDTLEKAGGNKFDLVLMNQKLPGMNGIEMLQKISKKKLNMPVIMIVPEGKESAGVKAMNKGACDYLTSDEIKTTSLPRAIHRAVHRKKLEKDIEKSIVKLERMAIKDGLTGLYNQNHFLEVLRSEFKKAQRHLQPLSCIMIDIDYFKSVNDTHGHQFGDYVLAQSADILKRIVRDTDFVARYGGEEFFVILPNTDREGAYILAERLRIAFSKKVFKKDGVSQGLTVSLGISSMSDHNVISDDVIIANADNALYRAKWRGRNNVCTYEETSIKEKLKSGEDPEKVKVFHSRFWNINESIKSDCIESAHDILLEIEGEWEYINEHSFRVGQYAEQLARGLSMSEEEANTVKRAALLHDIGMIGISTHILKKKDKLTAKEYSVIKRHSSIGMKIMEKTKMFEKELPLILYHHERFDGSGYPHKLKGGAIPYGARILALADAYDAMISNSNHKAVRTHEEALKELKGSAGKQFDPSMVKSFINIMDEK
jgi:diguanylate cyclase (GGDEF)-like protein/putative nucleotidyltransferase with HDIG domain